MADLIIPGGPTFSWLLLIVGIVSGAFAARLRPWLWWAFCVPPAICLFAVVWLNNLALRDDAPAWAETTLWLLIVPYFFIYPLFWVVVGSLPGGVLGGAVRWLASLRSASQAK